MVSIVTRLNENDPSLKRVELESMKDCRYDDLSRALRRNQTVQSFYVNEGVFDHEGFRSPTWKQLRMLLQSVSHMKNLEELGLIGKMSLDNIHDVQVIAKAISEHPVLREVKLQDFIIYAADHSESAPLLEPLLTSASSIDNLEAFQLQCFTSYKRWTRSYMTTQVLVPVCRSNRLQKLSLSNVGLRDEHFLTIAREVGNNRNTVLKELILNDNQNSDVGVEAMAQLLARNKTIEKLEIRNRTRLSKSTCELILHRLDNNHIVEYLHVNAPYEYRTEIDFYLLLNRAGRKALLDPDVVPEEAIDVLAAANGNVGVLMHLLRENPTLCQGQAEVVVAEEYKSDTPHLEETSMQPNNTTVETQAGQQNERSDRAFRGDDEAITSSEAKLETPVPEKLEILKNLADDSVLIWRRFWYRTASPSNSTQTG